MLAEIAALATTILNASKALKGLLESVEDAKARKIISEVQGQFIEIQSELLAIQANYQALAEAKRGVEAKLVTYEKWDSEASRYELKEIASGIVVYVLKSDNAHGEPSHWLCPACFQESKKSILQKPRVDYLDYKCPRCQFHIVPTAQSMPQGDDFTADYSSDY